MAGPFDDELTPEEEAMLNNPDAVPPAEEEGEGSIEEAIVEAGTPPAAEEPKPAEQQPVDQQPAAPAQDDAAAEERAFAEFLEKHKGKSVEELARLTYQQQKRANREASENRQTRERVSALAERARQAAEARTQTATDIEARKAAFREKLATDPDGAVTEFVDSFLNDKVQQADAAVIAARQEAAIEFADTHIPEFGNRWPEMQGLAKEIGFSDQELDAIDDGRPLVLLSLANHSARLMKAGLMDRNGNLVNVPALDPTPVDPRLAAPNPQPTLGGARPGAKTNRSVQEQLNDLMNLSEDEFNKLDPKVLEDLMRQAA